MDKSVSIEIIGKIVRSLIRSGRFRDAFSESLKAIRQGKHPDSIILALTRVRDRDPPPEYPRAYFWHIINIESGNYHEKDSIKKSNYYKGESVEDVKDILRGILK